MKLHIFVSRLQELNICLAEFPPDTEGQETASLSRDKIIGMIYHFMLATWKNNMIQQDFNYTNSTVKVVTDFFETRVENLEPNMDR